MNSTAPASVSAATASHTHGLAARQSSVIQRGALLVLGTMLLLIALLIVQLIRLSWRDPARPRAAQVETFDLPAGSLEFIPASHQSSAPGR